VANRCIKNAPTAGGYFREKRELGKTSQGELLYEVQQVYEQRNEHD
jgi:hypothetical protein